MPTWHEIRSAYGRGRRALRQAMLEPVLVGWPVLREVVTNALAARGHLVLCDLGDVRFFVDPSDRVVGPWLMWPGGGPPAAGGCGVRRRRRPYRYAHDLCVAHRPLRARDRIRARAAQCRTARE